MSTKKPRWIPLPLEPAAPWFRLPALTRSIGQYLFAAAQDRPILGIELVAEQVRGEDSYPQAESWALRQMSPDPDERKTIRAAIRKIVKRGLLVAIPGGMRLLYTPESYAEHQIYEALLDPTVTQPSANHTSTVPLRSANGAPTVTQPSGNGAPTGEGNSAKSDEVDPHREREKQREIERENAREARDPLPSARVELEDGEPEPDFSTPSVVALAYKARLIVATGNPPSQSHKVREHYRAIAGWVDAKDGDPKRIITTLMDGFFRDKWVQKKSYPLGALASSPGKYFDAAKGRGGRGGGGFTPTSPESAFNGKGTKLSELGPAPPGEAE